MRVAAVEDMGYFLPQNMSLLVMIYLQQSLWVFTYVQMLLLIRPCLKPRLGRLENEFPKNLRIYRC